MPLSAGQVSQTELPPRRAVAATSLGTETVSRVLKRFQADGLLQVDRRELELAGRAALEELAAPVLRD